MHYSVAYLMHVDWNWIKQRPHFIYEQLTHYYKIDLIYVHKIWEKKQNPKGNKINNIVGSKFQTLKKLPYSGKINFLKRIEGKLNFLVSEGLNQYDIIWITSPIILDFVDQEVLKGKFIIYDCMDDFPNFYSDQKLMSKAREKEQRLIQISNMILVSSSYLKQIIELTYSDTLRCPVHLINNGISNRMLEGSSPSYNKQSSEFLNLFYIGTVGDWIDFKMILILLEHYSNIKVTMVGPVITNTPKHPRLIYTGKVEHERLINSVVTADAFIMPFKINELIRSVDPVKIYEYIFFGKPVISVRYEELYKFLPYIYLYDNKEDLFSLIDSLQISELESIGRDDVLAFLKNHTWEERCKNIVDILKESGL